MRECVNYLHGQRQRGEGFLLLVMVGIVCRDGRDDEEEGR